MDKYYTAREAAAVLGLNYHTFLARVRRGQYTGEWAGNQILFLKSSIDLKATTSNATDQLRMEETAR
jgi:hypothetical protein